MRFVPDIRSHQFLLSSFLTFEGAEPVEGLDALVSSLAFEVIQSDRGLNDLEAEFLPIPAEHHLMTELT